MGQFLLGSVATMLLKVPANACSTPQIVALGCCVTHKNNPLVHQPTIQFVSIKFPLNSTYPILVAPKLTRLFSYKSTIELASEAKMSLRRFLPAPMSEVVDERRLMDRRPGGTDDERRNALGVEEVE